MYHNHTTSTMAFRYSMLFMSYYPSVHLCTTYIMCYIIFFMGLFGQPFPNSTSAACYPSQWKKVLWC